MASAELISPLKGRMIENRTGKPTKESEKPAITAAYSIQILETTDGTSGTQLQCKFGETIIRISTVRVEQGRKLELYLTEQEYRSLVAQLKSDAKVISFLRLASEVLNNSLLTKTETSPILDPQLVAPAVLSLKLE